jgi:KaiC/GvpD/RAD55 family RecA-like ATPase
MRVTTGIKRLDRLLSGGLPENSVVLLSGGPGTGKTLFSLNYLLEGAKAGEKCCYVSLSENSDELVKAAECIKSLSDIKKYLGKNLAIECISMCQSNITMKRFVDIVGNYPKIDRIVIDNMNKLLLFSENKKSYRSYLAEIISSLRNMKSSILICETDNDDQLDSGGSEAFDCDGIIQLIFMDLEEKPMRSLVVHKMRYTSFDPKMPYEMLISPAEIKLTETKII